jgi:hypothetical protein
MRKLQENPNDMQALSEMYRAQKDVSTGHGSLDTVGLTVK